MYAFFLKKYRKKEFINFQILDVNVDEKQLGFPAEILLKISEKCQMGYEIIEYDIYRLVTEKNLPGKSYCSLCSRLKRGISYDSARKYGFNKIGLRYHREDALETFMMNIFFSGQFGSMLAHYKIQTEDLYVIRPLFSDQEDWITDFVQAQGLPIISCNLCGSQENLTSREMKELLTELPKRYPKLKDSAFRSLQNRKPKFLFDKKLWEKEIPRI